MFQVHFASDSINFHAIEDLVLVSFDELAPKNLDSGVLDEFFEVFLVSELVSSFKEEVQRLILFYLIKDLLGEKLRM